MCKQKQLASHPTCFCACALWMNSNCLSPCVTPGWKGQGAVKIGTGDAQPQLPADGRTPRRQPQSQTVLYHVVAMKAAGVRMGWPCSFFAEARRLVFIQLNRTWRSF